MKAMLARLMEQGVSTLAPPGMLFMAPPLSVTRAEINKWVYAIADAFTLADRLTVN